MGPIVKTLIHRAERALSQLLTALYSLELLHPGLIYLHLAIILLRPVAVSIKDVGEVTATTPFRLVVDTGCDLVAVLDDVLIDVIV